MAQLVAAVSATVKRWKVDEIPDARYVKAGDEIVEVLTRYPSRGVIRVLRGAEDSTAASHDAGTELESPLMGGAGGGLPDPITDQVNIDVAGDTALVAGTAGGEVTLGDTPSGGALLKVRGTSAFKSAVLRVDDIDSANQYVEVNSFGAVHVAADEENGQISVTSINGSAFVSVAKGDESRSAMISTNKGVSMFGITSAPSDGSLAPGEISLWFDQTNGAAKLMIKAKQADGTVRTGSVDLT